MKKKTDKQIFSSFSKEKTRKGEGWTNCVRSHTEVVSLSS